MYFIDIIVKKEAILIAQICTFHQPLEQSEASMELNMKRSSTKVESCV